MKTARMVLKIISASLCGVAAILAVIAYWDKISGLFSRRNHIMDTDSVWDEEDIPF